MSSVFSVDVEEWYHANYSGVDAPPPGAKSMVVEHTRRLLLLLRRSGNRATFFVLGEVAEAYPDLIREIAAGGHEVASHGYTHDMVHELSREEFGVQARRSKLLLEEITSQPVYGYRAASWSVTPATPWFWSELSDSGYKYSSSIFPFKTPLYGDNHAPRGIHERDGVTEVPASTAVLFGRRVPFSGGFYLRVLPSTVIRRLQRRLEREGLATIVYIHPREIDPDQPRLRLSLFNHLIHYWGLKGAEAKLRSLLESSRYESFAAVLGIDEAAGPDAVGRCS